MSSILKWNTELPEQVAEHLVVEDIYEHVLVPETGICQYPQRQRRPPHCY